MEWLWAESEVRRAVSRQLDSAHPFGYAAEGWAPGLWLSGLVEGVDGQAAQEFGVEVGGFLRHDFAGERDVFELVEGDGFDEEGDVGFAGCRPGRRLRRLRGCTGRCRGA